MSRTKTKATLTIRGLMMNRIGKEVRKKVMIRVCAWCGVVMGEIEGEGITHGICTDCQAKMAEEIKKKLTQKEEG